MRYINTEGRTNVLMSQWVRIQSRVHHVWPLDAEDLLSDFWQLESRCVNYFHKKFKIQKFRLAVEWPPSVTEMLSSVSSMALSREMHWHRAPRQESPLRGSWEVRGGLGV